MVSLGGFGSKLLVHPAALSVLSGVLLAIPFLFPKFYLLSWFSLLPLLRAIEGEKLGRCYLYALLCGLSLFIVSTYWMVNFVANMKGFNPWMSSIFAMVFWFYSAQVIAVAVCVAKLLRRRLKLSFAWVLPLCFPLATACYPQLFPMRIAESQSEFLVAIQGVEWTGVYGLDWLIVGVNTVLYNLLRRRSVRPGFHGWITCGVLTLWFAFGFMCLANLEKLEGATQSQTIQVAVLQPNNAPSIAVPPPAKGYTYAWPPELQLSLAMASKGAELVVWPEARLQGYFRYPHVKRAFSAALNGRDTAILFQDLEPQGRGRSKQLYNTAVLLQGQGDAQLYRKNKLIPFGERAPVFFK